MTALDRIGVSLWGMQSTATRPQSFPALYRRYADDAVLLEEHGFHSMWSAEHHLWYDGWCPALLHAAAFAAVRTSRLRFGTAMALLPQHDPVAFARAVTTLDRLSDGRVEVGVALGHRDTEFDAVGLRRDQRGRRMESAFEVLRSVWNGDHGDTPPTRPPRMWVGGLAPAAISRAARFGHGLMLPESLHPTEIAAICESYRAEADDPGPIGVTRLVHVEPDPRAGRSFREAARRHYAEEIGAWWILKGAPGFERPEALERQVQRMEDVALVGAADHVAAGVDAAFEAGVDLVLLRLNYDFTLPAAFTRQVERVGREVAPLLKAAPRPA